MKFTMIAASALMKHFTQKQAQVDGPSAAHERALLLLKERVMVLKEPLENMMQSLPSLSLPPQLQSLQSLQFKNCQESIARFFEEPIHSKLAIAATVLLVFLWVIVSRRRQDKTLVRSLEKAASKKKQIEICCEREARWKTLLQNRPGTNNSQEMAGWLLEVLAVSDLQSPLSHKPLAKHGSSASIDSNDGTATSYTTSTTSMSDLKVTMPFVNTWNLFERNKEEESEDEEDQEWEDQNPGQEISC